MKHLNQVAGTALLAWACATPQADAQLNYFSDFNDGVPDWDSRRPLGTATETDGQLRMRAQLPGSGGVPVYSSTWVTWRRNHQIRDAETLEYRVDLINTSQSDVVAGFDYDASNNPGEGLYAFTKDASQMYLTKFIFGAGVQADLFYAPTPIKHHNVTLSMALTGSGGSVRITCRVLDKDANDAVLFERTVVDTPGIDPTAGSGTPDSGPPFGLNGSTGTQLYLGLVTDGTDPEVEVIYDNFTWEYRMAAPEVDAGNLIVDSRNHGNDGYGDWAGSNFVWGAGYPIVNVSVDTDETLTFPNGLEKQGMIDASVESGSAKLDNPTFTAAYSGDLAFSGLICDAGTMQITYTLAFPTPLVDIMLCDLDEGDVAQIEIFDVTGQPISPTNLDLVLEGDLSLNINAPGQPPAQRAIPPVWDPASGTLTAAVSWNENRSFTVLRPRTAISEVRISATGLRSNNDPNGAGSHIYTALWATPRALEITDVRNASSSEIELTWTSLPGFTYRILGSLDFSWWRQETSVEGFAAPATHSKVTIPAGMGSRFFRVTAEQSMTATE